MDQQLPNAVGPTHSTILLIQPLPEKLVSVIYNYTQITTGGSCHEELKVQAETGNMFTFSFLGNSENEMLLQKTSEVKISCEQ